MLRREKWAVNGGESTELALRAASDAAALPQKHCGPGLCDGTGSGWERDNQVNTIRRAGR